MYLGLRFVNPLDLCGLQMSRHQKKKWKSTSRTLREWEPLVQEESRFNKTPSRHQYDLSSLDMYIARSGSRKCWFQDGLNHQSPDARHCCFILGLCLGRVVGGKWRDLVYKKERTYYESALMGVMVIDSTCTATERGSERHVHIGHVVGAEFRCRFGHY